MINLGLLLVGFILGIFALGLLLFLVVLHKPRVSAPTLRRNRDKPLPEVVPSWERDIGGIRYEHLGMTGEEV